MTDIEQSAIQTFDAYKTKKGGFMNRENLIKYLKTHAEIALRTEPEYESVKDHFDSGDAEADLQLRESIYKEIDNGNEWAWCTVKVTASLGTFEKSSYLGCCSYKNETDFRKDAYFQDLQNEAIESLADYILQIGEVFKNLSSLTI